MQVLPLWRIMAMSHYSRVEPGPAESARARDIFTRLYKPQSPVRKLRFMFAAAFGKASIPVWIRPWYTRNPSRSMTTPLP